MQYNIRRNEILKGALFGNRLQLPVVYNKMQMTGISQHTCIEASHAYIVYRYSACKRKTNFFTHVNVILFSYACYNVLYSGQSLSYVKLVLAPGNESIEKAVYTRDYSACSLYYSCPNDIMDTVMFLVRLK